MQRVKLIRPIGDADLDIVQADHKLRGLPPTEMEWVCQHSCAPETIPDCMDFNCEGTCIVNRADLAAACARVEEGKLAAFDGVEVQLTLEIPTELGGEIQRFLQNSAAMPALQPQGETYVAIGSLLAFGRLCARRLTPSLSADAYSLLQEIEQTLLQQFYSAGRALFHQRFADLRTRPTERGNIILLLTHPDEPAAVFVGWEEPPSRRSCPESALPVLPDANTGYRVSPQTEKNLSITRTMRIIDAIPGSSYGPSLRLAFRVDQETTERIRSLCAAQENAPSLLPPDQAMRQWLSSLIHELGLPTPPMPPEAHQDETTAQPTHFIHRLLLSLPFPSSHS